MFLSNFVLTPIWRSKVKRRSLSRHVWAHLLVILTIISHDRPMYVAAVATLLHILTLGVQWHKLLLETNLVIFVTWKHNPNTIQYFGMILKMLTYLPIIGTADDTFIIKADTAYKLFMAFQYSQTCPTFNIP